MTQREQEHAYSLASIYDQGEVGNAAKRITCGLGFYKTFMRQCEVCLFGSSLAASAFNRDPKYLARIWTSRYQINASVINPSTLKAVARKQIKQN